MVDTNSSPPSASGSLHRPAPALTWRDHLGRLADATGTTPARILAGGVAVAVAAVAALWLMRPAPTPAEVALPFTSTTVAAATTSTTAAPSTLVVHVAGAVAHPGLQELPPGARVADAIAAAGGLSQAADQSQINLAAAVVDGERVYVVARGEAAPPIAVGLPTTGAGPPSATSPVDLNVADAAALDSLPGIGPATAAAIVTYRGQIGAFTSVDELLDVPGIGEAKLEALRDLVRVG